MDPTELQTDTDNDASSLEKLPDSATDDNEIERSANAGNVPGGSDDNSSAGPATGQGQATDTSQAAGTALETGQGDEPSAPTLPPKKPSLLRRLWRRVNVYLLLFILLLIVVAMAVTMLTLRNRPAPSANNTATSSQSLSTDALKQLANSDVNVGNSKQVLNVESNAVFAGSVLARGNLEVAGTVKIGGNLSLPGITVSGSSQFAQVLANSLAVSGPANVQGVLTAKNGLAVTGNSTFSGNIATSQLTTGTLQINGDLNLTHHIAAGGPIPSLGKGVAVGGGGSASLSGSDTSGSIVINTGSAPPAGCFATVTFTQAFASTPHVIVTPVGAGAAGLSYYVNRSTGNFSICAANAAPAGQTFGFDYIVLD